ncbi:sodium:solute symporter family protein [candidate division KSB1 bacterium]|nr:sodium:solute symporter family protein [candidate division KSB1 bacterium]
MEDIAFGSGAVLFFCFYLVGMLSLGYWARHIRKIESLDEFYLAGKSLGGFVLLLTLYATQYSGNTLLGYPGEAYRLGFAWIMSVGFMMSIVVVYLLFAPRLYALARRHKFVTPGDWIDHRFGSPTLTVITNLLLIVAVANFLLAQLMAMGHVVAGLSGKVIPYWGGVVFLALIIIVYETLGGMRAVAWTDFIQGLMLLLGLMGLLIAAVPDIKSLRVVTEWIAANVPEKAVVPSWSIIRTWISTVLLVGFSGAVYPQAIQRIYAARSSRSLKHSLSLMVFMPLASTFVVFLIGILGIAHFANLEGVTADRVMPLLLQEWAGQSTWLYILVVMVITGILAAIMSTADSVLLSLSSILAKDFLGKTLLKHAPETQVTKAGKYVSWGIMAMLVVIALIPRITLWGLTELKMELLSQVSPVIILGVLWRKLSSQAALAGVLGGSTLAVSLTLAGYGKLWGFHAGLLGWGLNLCLCVTMTYFFPRNK